MDLNILTVFLFEYCDIDKNSSFNKKNDQIFKSRKNPNVFFFHKIWYVVTAEEIAQFQ